MMALRVLVSGEWICEKFRYEHRVDTFIFRLLIFEFNEIHYCGTRYICIYIYKSVISKWDLMKNLWVQQKKIKGYERKMNRVCSENA